MEAQELDGLMGEVGPLDEAILACVRTAEATYAVRFAETDVLVELDVTRNRVVLSTDLGTPPAARAGAIYETLLSYNLLWRETGGLRMALTGRNGAVIQLIDLAGQEITAQNIAVVAGNLAERTRVWQAYFESEAAGRPPQPDSMAEFIRV